MSADTNTIRIEAVSHGTLAGNDPIEDKLFFDQDMGFYGVYDGQSLFSLSSSIIAVVGV